MVARIGVARIGVARIGVARISFLAVAALFVPMFSSLAEAQYTGDSYPSPMPDPIGSDMNTGTTDTGTTDTGTTDTGTTDTGPADTGTTDTGPADTGTTDTGTTDTGTTDTGTTGTGTTDTGTTDTATTDTGTTDTGTTGTGTTATGTTGTGTTGTGGDGGNCCLCTPIMWIGGMPAPTKQHMEKYNRTERMFGYWPFDGPDNDLWWGDDECYQKAEAELVTSESPIGGLYDYARAHSWQDWSMVDWSMFTKEVGFPTGHVHPSATIEGKFVWGFSGSPPGNNPQWPGLRMNCNVTGEVSVSAWGAISYDSRASASAGTAEGYLEWSHPCACMNPAHPTLPGARVPYFTERRKVKGTMSTEINSKQRVSVARNGETLAKERSKDDAPFWGSLPGFAWSSETMVEMQNPLYRVTYAQPLPSLAIEAQTNASTLEMDFKCVTSVTGNGSADNRTGTHGIAAGAAMATARIAVDPRVQPCAMPAPVTGGI